MNRREFLALCGLAAGASLNPSTVARVIRETCVFTRKPYLILPRNPAETLCAMPSDRVTDFTLET